MPLKSHPRLFLCLCLGVILVLLLGCSEDPEAVNTTTFPLASPARLFDVDASTLLVSDYNGEALHLLDKSSLEPLQSLRIKGKPTGVAFFQGRYYVGNRSTRSVDVLDTDGALLFHFGGQTGVFQQVNDLAVVTSGAEPLVYVLDTGAAEIRIFDLDGNVASPAIGTGILVKPTAMVVDVATGNILVSDFGTPGTPGTHESIFGPDPDEVPPGIVVLDPSGALLDRISGLLVEGGGGGGMGMGGDTTYTPVFSAPQGLALDQSGHVYVVDTVSGEIQVFNLADKTQVSVLGLSEVDGDRLSYPLDVWVDAEAGDVYVADNRNARITVYRGGASL